MKKNINSEMKMHKKSSIINTKGYSTQRENDNFVVNKNDDSYEINRIKKYIEAEQEELKEERKLLSKKLEISTKLLISDKQNLNKWNEELSYNKISEDSKSVMKNLTNGLGNQIKTLGKKITNFK